MRVLAFLITMVAGMVNVSCDQSNKNDMKHMTSHTEHTPEYACPMHPEVTGHKGDKCPKCGMSLEKVNAESNISMNLVTNPDRIEAGKEAELAFTPKDKSDSTVVVKLQEAHKKKIHVIVVNEELTWFDHIHAEPDKGAYKVTETFPAAGKYLVYADYKSTVGGLQTDRLEVNVKGNKNTSSHHKHQAKIKSETNGYSLSIPNGKHLTTGSVSLPIILEKDGKKVERADIENYLGAVAHIILIRLDDKDFVHIHPESTEISPIHAHADISKPGLYRMWVQFQTNGKVHTADFTLNFEQGAETTEVNHEHSHSRHNH